MWAHPHSRGENHAEKAHPAFQKGSSPLTRGKRQERASGDPGAGLIPAHAGKTPRARTRRACPGAHPRSRRENTPSHHASRLICGSSPLMRGKPGLWWCASRGLRLIPAHAGKTRFRRRRRHWPRAHPHSRGENPPIARRDPTPPGSSPLIRGKHRHLVAHSLAVRLIPAHAGKTSRPPWALSPAWAHPHSRGENGISFVRAIFTADSSPLMRGKRGVLLRALSGPGLIPAHAGKTSMALQRSPRSPAHPRSHGENQLALCVARDV